MGPKKQPAPVAGNIVAQLGPHGRGCSADTVGALRALLGLSGTEPTKMRSRAGSVSTLSGPTTARRSGSRTTTAASSTGPASRTRKTTTKTGGTDGPDSKTQLSLATEVVNSGMRNLIPPTASSGSNPSSELANLADCVVAAFDCLEKLASPTGKATTAATTAKDRTKGLLPYLQFESGLACLVPKLMSCGLVEAALRETIRLKRRLDGLVGHRSRTIPAGFGAATLCELLDFSPWNPAMPATALESIVTTYQTAVLRQFGAHPGSFKPDKSRRAVDLLDFSKRSNLAALVCAELDGPGCSAEKAEKTRRSIEKTAHLLLAACPSVGSAADPSAGAGADAGMGADTAFRLQAVAMELRLVAAAGPTEAEKTAGAVDGFGKALAAFVRRTSGVASGAAARYKNAAEAYGRISARCKHRPAVDRAAGVFLCLSELAGTVRASGMARTALEWAERARDCLDDADCGRKVETQTRIAALVLAAARPGKQSDDDAELDRTEGMLAADISVRSRQLDSIVGAAVALRRAGIRRISTDDGRATGIRAVAIGLRFFKRVATSRPADQFDPAVLKGFVDAGLAAVQAAADLADPALGWKIAGSILGDVVSLLSLFPTSPGSGSDKEGWAVTVSALYTVFARSETAGQVDDALRLGADVLVGCSVATQRRGGFAAKLVARGRRLRQTGDERAVECADAAIDWLVANTDLEALTARAEVEPALVDVFSGSDRDRAELVRAIRLRMAAGAPALRFDGVEMGAQGVLLETQLTAAVELAERGDVRSDMADMATAVMGGYVNCPIRRWRTAALVMRLPDMIRTAGVVDAVVKAHEAADRLRAGLAVDFGFDAGLATAAAGVVAALLCAAAMAAYAGGSDRKTGSKPAAPKSGSDSGPDPTLDSTSGSTVQETQAPDRTDSLGWLAAGVAALATVSTGSTISPAVLAATYDFCAAVAGRLAVDVAVAGLRLDRTRPAVWTARHIQALVWDGRIEEADELAERDGDGGDASDDANADAAAVLALCQAEIAIRLGRDVSPPVTTTDTPPRQVGTVCRHFAAVHLADTQPDSLLSALVYSRQAVLVEQRRWTGREARGGGPAVWSVLPALAESILVLAATLVRAGVWAEAVYWLDLGLRMVKPIGAVRWEAELEVRRAEAMLQAGRTGTDVVGPVGRLERILQLEAVPGLRARLDVIRMWLGEDVDDDDDLAEPLGRLTISNRSANRTLTTVQLQRAAFILTQPEPDFEAARKAIELAGQSTGPDLFGTPTGPLAALLSAQSDLAEARALIAADVRFGNLADAGVAMPAAAPSSRAGKSTRGRRPAEPTFVPLLRSARMGAAAARDQLSSTGGMQLVAAACGVVAAATVLLSAAGAATEHDVREAAAALALPASLAASRDAAASRAERTVGALGRAVLDSVVSMAGTDTANLPHPILAGLDALGPVPPSWAIRSIAVSDDGADLFVARLDPGVAPLVVRLPIGAELGPDGFSLGIGLAELAEIVSLSNFSAHQTPTPGLSGGRTRWWREREALDRRLATWAGNVQRLWLGGARAVLAAATGDGRFHRAMAACACRYAGAGLSVDPRLWDLFLGLAAQDRQMASRADGDGDGDGDGDDDGDGESDVADLLCLVLDSAGAAGLDEIDFPAWAAEVAGIVARQPPPARSETILVLDKTLQAVPWESLACLQSVPVTRLPSVDALAARLSLVSDHPDGRVEVRRNRAATLLNPGRDLPATEAKIGPYVNQLAGTKVEPDEATIVDALRNNDVFLFFGHGSGAQYVRPRAIRALGSDDGESSRKCAVALLMGCSSAAVDPHGRSAAFGPAGMVLAYLAGGAPAVVGALWDVTDRDCDRFAVACGNHWGLWHLEGGNDRGEESKSLAESVADARRACYLRYLNGAAMVVYGVPVHVV